MPPWKLPLLWLLLGAAAPVHAETQYVTDILRLGLYAQAETDGKPVRYLTSGTALEMLERRGNTARVRAPDGAEGWVRATYLVDEQPARFRLAQLESSHTALADELAGTRRELAAAQDTVTSLQNQLASIEDSGRSLAALERENRALQRRIGSMRYLVPGSWALAGLGVSLLLGFIVGVTFLDYLIRRRFGGVRIY
ncbi:hypothetical protein BH24PSE2_BH24PSE2_04180 [soil metagenome]